MSDLVGNPKDRFSHDVAHFKAVAVHLLTKNTFDNQINLSGKGYGKRK